MTSPPPRSILAIATTSFLFLAVSSQATMTLTPWTPIFKGVAYATGTNTPSADLPNLNIAHAIRVDLKDPDIELFSSPPFPDYQVDQQESGGYTVSDFLQTNHLQV